MTPRSFGVRSNISASCLGRVGWRWAVAFRRKLTLPGTSLSAAPWKLNRYTLGDGRMHASGRDEAVVHGIKLVDVPLLLITDDPPPRTKALTKQRLGYAADFHSPTVVDNPRPLAFARDSRCEHGLGHEGEPIGSLTGIVRLGDFDDDAAGASKDIRGEGWATESEGTKGSKE